MPKHGSGKRRRSPSSSEESKARKKKEKERDKDKADKKKDRGRRRKSDSEASTRKVSSSGSRSRRRKSPSEPPAKRAKEGKAAKEKAAKDTAKRAKDKEKHGKAEKHAKDTEKSAKESEKEDKAEKHAKDKAKKRAKEVDEVFEAVEKPDKKADKRAKDSDQGATSADKGTADPRASPTSSADGAPKPRLDLAELQKSLDKAKDNLQLYVLKAKQEHEDKKETKEKREQREKEYFKASFGEPCGPDNRILLEAELGRGVFSSVYRGRDTGMQGKEFAIKFIRQNPTLKKAYEKEVKLMRRLRTQASEKDPEGGRCFLGLSGVECFEHEGHLVLVCQLMKCDLRAGLIKYGQGHGLPMLNVRSYARDIFLALRALRKAGIIHSDVKPDNLLMTLDKANVRLSDFGCAMDVSERMYTDYIQPRFYRAPEIMLGQNYGTQIDVWSAGVTIFELATGRILFRGDSNNDMIHQMLKVCGAFPKKMATSGKAVTKHFTGDGDLKLKEKGGAEVVVPMTKFATPLQPVPGLLEEGARASAAGTDVRVHQALVRQLADLLGKCLVPDQTERSTPEQLLDHRFLQKSG